MCFSEGRKIHIRRNLHETGADYLISDCMLRILAEPFLDKTLFFSTSQAREVFGDDVRLQMLFHRVAPYNTGKQMLPPKTSLKKDPAFAGQGLKKLAV
jgi:hypothetical protein